MIFLILGIIAWLMCGWLGGYGYRKDFLWSHLGWMRCEEMMSRFLISLGPLFLIAVIAVSIDTGHKCNSFDKKSCSEYSSNLVRRYPSWFGKSSDYEKILHPEISINL